MYNEMISYNPLKEKVVYSTANTAYIYHLSEKTTSFSVPHLFSVFHMGSSLYIMVTRIHLHCSSPHSEVLHIPLWQT